MEISGVIDPDFEFSTLWTLPLAESIPKFFSQVILYGGGHPVNDRPHDDHKHCLEGCTHNQEKRTHNQQNRTYYIGVVSCFTLFPLLLLPLTDLLHCHPNGVLGVLLQNHIPGSNLAVQPVVSGIVFFSFCLVYPLTWLAAVVLTLPAIVPIAMARGGYEFFKKEGLLDAITSSLKQAATQL